MLRGLETMKALSLQAPAGKRVTPPGSGHRGDARTNPHVFVSLPPLMLLPSAELLDLHRYGSYPFAKVSCGPDAQAVLCRE